MPLTGTRRSYKATYAVLALAVGGYALLQSLVIPVLPTIQAGLHTSQNSVTWVLTAYLLSASIFTPIMGRLGDMYGKERLLVLTLVALDARFPLGGRRQIRCTVMIVARVIQGIGGGVLPLSFGLIRDEFPKEKVIGAIGVIAALAAAGAGLGIALAGPIVDALNYHWLFWIPMIVLAFGAVAAHLVVPESKVRTPGIDQLAGRALALGVARGPDPRHQRGADVGLGVRPGHRSLARRGRAGRRLGHRRGPLGSPADRHEHDADSRRCGRRTSSRCCSASGCTRSSRSCPSSCRPRRRRATASASASPNRD